MNHTLDNYSYKSLTLKKYCNAEVMHEKVMKFLWKLIIYTEPWKVQMPFYDTDASIDMSQIFPWFKEEICLLETFVK